MARTLSSKDLGRLLKGFEAQGCTVRRQNDGYKVLPADGSKPLTIHLTLSDKRGMMNLRAQAKRQGFVWPLD